MKLSILINYFIARGLFPIVQALLTSWLPLVQGVQGSLTPVVSLVCMTIGRSVDEDNKVFILGLNVPLAQAVLN